MMKFSSLVGEDGVANIIGGGEDVLFFAAFELGRAKLLKGDGWFDGEYVFWDWLRFPFGVFMVSG